MEHQQLDFFCLTCGHEEPYADYPPFGIACPECGGEMSELDTEKSISHPPRTNPALPPPGGSHER
jgi:Zn finger protein HypA/HybF involved in hydrogenase expression